MTDGMLLELVKSGGISGTLIACALIYLALQVRALQKSVDAVTATIGQKVLPMLEDHGERIATLEERTKNA